MREARWNRLRRGASRLVTSRTRNGVLTYSSADSVIGYHLYVYGHYEADYIARAIAIMNQTTKPASGGMVDIGANLGMTCIGFLLRGGAAHAIAIEPDPFNFELLERNIRQNGLEGRVIAVRSAIGSSPENGRLLRSGTNLGAHYLVAENGASEPSDDFANVVITTLDDVVAARWDGPIRLVWMDIEGNEGYALLGAQRTLVDVPFVALEVWPAGIARSGFGHDNFLELLDRRFDAFADLAVDGATRPIADFRSAYEALQSSHRFSQFLFVSRVNSNES
jgi:FkbM family methyltransferase